MHYVVNKSNQIVELDEAWDASAAEQTQTGARPTSDTIIGRPLEDFLAGDATKMFVRAAFDAARLLGEARRLPYRCDTKHAHRRFEMVISPLPDGQVKVEHVLIETIPRVAPDRRRKVVAKAGWRCSQCLFVRPVGSAEWIPSNLEPGAIVAEDVCPACARRLFELAPQGPSEQDIRCE